LFSFDVARINAIYGAVISDKIEDMRWSRKRWIIF